MCTRPTYLRYLATDRLEIGHLRMLRVAGALRAASKALSSDALAAEWRSVDAVKAATERDVARVAARMFAEQARAVRERLPALLERLGAATTMKADPDPMTVAGVVDLQLWARLVEEGLSPELVGVVQRGFRTGYLRVGASLPSIYQETAASRAVLDAVLDKTKAATDYTREQLASAIGRGLESGDSIGEITRDVMRRFDDWQEWRARQIAQTTVTATFEAGQQDAFREVGVGRHAWLSTRDGDVRESHWEVDGEERDLGAPFSNGLAFPGDPVGSAGEVIGCRCTTRPILPSKASTPTAAGEHLVDTSEMNERELQRVELALRDLNIRMAHAAGEKSLSTLAERFCCSESTARRAIWGA